MATQVDMLATDMTREELSSCEETIEQGLVVFFAVGTALAAVRDRRGYKYTHKTFALYVKERWDKSRDWADKEIAAARAYSNVQNAETFMENDESRSAPSFTQSLALASLPEEQVVEFAQTVNFATASTQEVKRLVREKKEALALLVEPPGEAPSEPPTDESDEPELAQEEEQTEAPEHAVTEVETENAEADDDFVFNEADLVYDPKARKRSLGASDLVKRIYMLLDEQPEGMTDDDLHAELKKSWSDTDAYRAYSQKYKGEERGPKFRDKAQLWRTKATLGNMKRKDARTAKKKDGKWYKGERAPNVATRHVIIRADPLDAQAERIRLKAEEDEQVRREEVKIKLHAMVNDPEVEQRYKRVFKLAYDYIVGRSPT